MVQLEERRLTDIGKLWRVGYVRTIWPFAEATTHLL
jgi:hypothetical protein